MNIMQKPADSRPSTAQAARLAIRSGAITGNTAGLVPGHVQANIVILPSAQAESFAAFCRANPQSCPLLATSQPGDPALPALGEIDMRHDLPGYRVFRDGLPTIEVTDVASLWRDDLVTCAIGCSFTFEAALIAAGIPLRHVTEGRNVAMYRTNVLTVPVGPFGGPLVVSMRPVKEADADRAAAITACYPDMHGAPIHRGDPAALGIADLMQPDYGDPVTVEPGEIPVFWACGVTSQVAVEAAKLPFFIAHAPGKMLITDRRHAAS
jgi:uncharacterized protein YcsI (UPF0317 family)